MDTDTITVAEAAEALGISVHGVRYLIRAGRLRARRQGPPGPRGWYTLRRADLEKIEYGTRGRPKTVDQ
jgi:excisionase family DNA binding protein